jgi:GDPmannose 4,6-dehydratase
MRGELLGREHVERLDPLAGQTLVPGAGPAAGDRRDAGRVPVVTLGDLSARRDWGYAADYVQAMWLMLQQDEPGDYVIASGESHSVEELVELAFAHVGLAWRDHVRVDPALVRGKAELHDLVGDATRARTALGWEPAVDFRRLVELLVEADLERLRTDSSSPVSTITGE